MTTPNEYTLVEKPILEALTGRYGYHYIRPDEHPFLRDRENEVLFKPILIQGNWGNWRSSIRRALCDGPVHALESQRAADQT